MKLGAENTKKTILAMGLFVVALFLTFRMLSSNSNTSSAATPTTASPAPASAPSTTRRTATRRPARTSNTNQQKKTDSATPNLDPRLKLDELKATENTEYTGHGRNIFMAQSEPEIPKPITPAMKKTEPLPVPVVQTPPPPPPIPIKFFGFANQQGTRKVFLSSGEDVFVAGEGEIVQRRYKIVKVNQNNIEVQDVLNNNVQTIPLTAG